MNYPAACLKHHWRLNLLEDDFVQNPYPYFEFLRDCQPAHRMANGSWVITRYTDIQNLLLNKTMPNQALGNTPSLYSLLNNRNSEKYTCADLANNMIAFKDGEAHKNLRKQVMLAFNKPLKTSTLTLWFLRQTLETLKQTEQCHALKDLGTPIALLAILDVLGIQTVDIASLSTLTNDVLYIFSQIPSHDDRARIDTSVQQLRALVKTSLVQTNSSPSNVMQAFSNLIKIGGISEQVAIDNLILLLVDGAQNVDNIIAMMLLWYKTYSDNTKEIMSNRTLVPLFIEECLRFETPVQFVGRVVKSNFELHGQTFKQNQTILLMLAAANRDCAVFNQADVFNIYRTENQPLTFGRGAHTCLGNQLVRQVMCMVFNAVLDIIPSYQIENKALLAQPSWQHRIGHRWIEDYLIHL